MTVDVVKFACPWCTVEMCSYEYACPTCGASPDEIPEEKHEPVPIIVTGARTTEIAKTVDTKVEDAVKK